TRASPRPMHAPARRFPRRRPPDRSVRPQSPKPGTYPERDETGDVPGFPRPPTATLGVDEVYAKVQTRTASRCADARGATRPQSFTMLFRAVRLRALSRAPRRVFAETRLPDTRICADAEPRAFAADGRRCLGAVAHDAADEPAV